MSRRRRKRARPPRRPAVRRRNARQAPGRCRSPAPARRRHRRWRTMPRPGSAGRARPRAWRRPGHRRTAARAAACHRPAAARPRSRTPSARRRRAGRWHPRAPGPGCRWRRCACTRPASRWCRRRCWSGRSPGPAPRAWRPGAAIRRAAGAPSAGTRRGGKARHAPRSPRLRSGRACAPLPGAARALPAALRAGRRGWLRVVVSSAAPIACYVRVRRCREPVAGALKFADRGGARGRVVGPVVHSVS